MLPEFKIGVFGKGFESMEDELIYPCHLAFRMMMHSFSTSRMIVNESPSLIRRESTMGPGIFTLFSFCRTLSLKIISFILLLSFFMSFFNFYIYLNNPFFRLL